MKCILVICPSINSYQVISTSQPTQLLFLSKQTNKNKNNIQNMPTKRKIKITSQKPSNIKNGQINKMRSNVYKSLLNSFVSSSLSWAWACSGVQLIYSVNHYARKIFFPMPALQILSWLEVGTSIHSLISVLDPLCLESVQVLSTATVTQTYHFKSYPFLSCLLPRPNVNIII